MRPLRSHLKHALLLLTLAPLPLYANTVRVYVTNSAGDSIDVIDPITNKVVQEIHGIEAAHGIAFAPVGSKVYVTDEANPTLAVSDRKRGNLLKKMALSDRQTTSR